jgi:RNA polymerase sigma factor (sigma-70 family)
MRTDEDLIADYYRKGRDDAGRAFEELKARRRKELVAYLVSLARSPSPQTYQAADDAVEQAFYKVAETRQREKARFQPGTGTVLGWLKVIGRNSLSEIGRKGRTRTAKEKKAATLRKGRGMQDAYEEACQRECWDGIMDCYSKLPDELPTRLKRVFELCFLHERSAKQVAAELGISEKAARARRSGSQKLMISCLTRKGLNPSGGLVRGSS